MRRRARTAGAALGGALVAWAVAAALLPSGLPLGVVLLGIVLGGLSGLTAMGLVILYRSARIINFAQAEIGGLAATAAVIAVVGLHWPYAVALPLGLVVAVATGAVIDRLVIRRLFEAPRLIVTVATVGIFQILGALELWLPGRFRHIRPLTTFTTPFGGSFTIGPIVFNGNHVVAVIAVPGALVALGWFFGLTDAGIAIRGAADANDRALLLGIPVRRLSLMTWMIAAGLSGVAAMLSAPILGPDLGVLAGPQVLLAPLAAAVLAGLDSLVVAFVAAVGIGVFEQAVFWSYPRSTAVDVALFGLVLAGLLLRRRSTTRGEDRGLGGYVAVREVRPVAPALRALPEVRLAYRGAAVTLGVLVVLVPTVLSDSRLTLLAYMAIYGLLAISLVVLAGWSGQVSLGQFAFAGVGAATTASLLLHPGVDLFVALACAALVGAAVAVVVGIPALRISGLMLAVATLAFAVPVSTYLLNSTYFPALTPSSVSRPVLLGRFRLDTALTFYYLCLAVLAVAVWLARNLRHTRAGRALLAVRDNERGAAVFSIRPVRTRLVAFAMSGALAGVAGGLYAVGLRGIGFGGFDPANSLEVFTMVVVGGLASVPGALLGAAYVEGAHYFLHGALQLLATGGGLLLVLLALPGGLADVVYRGRDRALRGLAQRRAMSVAGLFETAVFGTGAAEPGAGAGAGSGAAGGAARGGAAAGGRAAGGDQGGGADGDRRAGTMLRCRGLGAGYGMVRVLFGVDLDVAAGDVVALLGTNGAGKSTVLRVVSGLLPAVEGTVEFDGHDITAWSPIARVRAGLVTVPGGRGVFGSLTVAENLRLAAWLHRDDRAWVADARGQVDELFPVLRERQRTRAAELSGGEQQMLTLAQAILCRPRLLLIDELSLGLAPAVVGALLDVIRSMVASGVTVVVVEQSANVASAIADRAAFLERGQVRFSGDIAELMERDDIMRAVFIGSGSRSSSNVATRARAGAHRAAPGPRRPAPRPAAPAEPAAPALGVTGIARRFGGVVALDDVTLQAAQGQIVGIIGANGAGKTTLFDVCSGFVAPDAGRILLGGVDVTSRSPARRAGLGLGRLFQDARLFPSLTVAETLAVAMERTVEVRDPIASMLGIAAVLASERDVAGRVAELLEEFGLARYAEAFIAELSTGTRRVVELACCVAHAPAVVLLDEPTAGIAQRETEALGELLLTVADRTGATLLVVEHDVPFISALAGRLVCLDLGRVIADGPPSEVLRDPAVVSAYLGTDQEAIERSGRSARRGSTADAAPRRAPRTRVRA